MACFISGTTNQQKFKGSGGYTLENFFSTDLHELEKQPKTKVGGQLTPLAPPPLSGGATEFERQLPHITCRAHILSWSPMSIPKYSL